MRGRGRGRSRQCGADALVAMPGICTGSGNENLENVVGSVLPDLSEITRNYMPLLRPNGRFNDVKEYISTHFHLIREELVLAVRNGITAYRYMVTLGKADHLHEYQIHTNASVERTIFTDNVVIRRVRFPCTGPLEHVLFEYSSHFTVGTLLCFSCDNFESFLLATVVHRDPELLKNGILYVRFETDNIADLGTLYSRQFVIVDTGFYFDVSNHLLKGLRNIYESNLPFKEYIIDLHKRMKPPRYAENKMTEYCLGPLLSTRNSVPCQAGVEKKNKCNCKAARSRIHNLLGWKVISTDLDSSELEAVRSALTRSLAIIQAPPGTGKINVGARIIEILHHNSHVWNQENEPCPIVLLCATNNTLDRLLESILPTTEKIVRIAGKAQNNELARFNLGHRILTMKSSDLEKHQKRETDKKLDELSSIISITENKLTKSKFEILPLDELRGIIGTAILDRLILRPGLLMDTCNVLDFWLGVGDRNQFQNKSRSSYKGNKDAFVNNVGNSNLANVPSSDTEKINLSKAEDVKYVNEQRIIDKEFQDIIDDTFDLLKVSESNQKTNVSLKLNVAPMSLSECEMHTDLWNLEIQDRWRMYRFWLDKYIENCETELQNCISQSTSLLSDLAERNCKQEQNVTRDAALVGLTITAAAKYNHLVRSLKPKIVIVQDAGRFLEASVVTNLCDETQHLILIGDHQQLGPDVSFSENAQKSFLDFSLFERLIVNGLSYCKLTVQSRMRPCISRLLVPKVYKNLNDHLDVKQYGDVRGLEKNLFFLSHTVEEIKSPDGLWVINPFEVKVLVELCRYLLLQDYQPAQITILTSCPAQFFLFKKSMVGQLEEVNVCLLDNFQGEENDIILLSFVRSNNEGIIEPFTGKGRINLALSRAKVGLYSVGNFRLFRSQSLLWNEICEELEKEECIGNSIKLKCRYHAKTVPVATAEDLTGFKFNGCFEICMYQLPCGHYCPKRCHLEDREHKNAKCMEPCMRTLCKEKHNCLKLCWEECGNCALPIVSKLPFCHHVIHIPCFQDPASYVCGFPCPNYLECGHTGFVAAAENGRKCLAIVLAVLPCGHDGNVECHILTSQTKQLTSSGQSKISFLDWGLCHVLVPHVLRCGHTSEIPCYRVTLEELFYWTGSGSTAVGTKKFPIAVRRSQENLDLTNYRSLEAECGVPCRQQLTCGHICKGTCSQCFGGRIHAPCTEVCGKIQICGHPCVSACANSCPPCSFPRESSCPHDKWNAFCGFPQSSCLQPCLRSCDHFRCQHLCYQYCDRPPCDQPCNKPLVCGHSCVGLCGDPCPKLCRRCDRGIIEDMLRSTEIDPNKARFVELQECGHVFEISSLGQWFDHLQRSSHISLITCPSCKQPVQNNFHFGDIIKDNIQKVENVKHEKYQMMVRNVYEKKSLLNCVRTQLDQMLEHHLTFEKLNLVDFPAISSTDPRFILEELFTRLSAKYLPTDQGLLTLFANYYTVVLENYNIVTQFEEVERLSGSDFLSSSSFLVCTFIGNTLEAINERIFFYMDYGSQQFVDEITWEMHRLQLAATFMINFHEFFECENLDTQVTLSEVLHCVLSNSPFSHENKRRLTMLMDKLRNLEPQIDVQKSYGKGLMSLKSMEQDLWFGCPNGHVYCVETSNKGMIPENCLECQNLSGTK